MLQKSALDFKCSAVKFLLTIFINPASGCINLDAKPFQPIFSPTSGFSNSFMLVVNYKNYQLCSMTKR